MFLSISVDFFDVFLQFFVFQVFAKILNFFFPCRRRAEIYAAAAAADAATAAAAAAAAAAAGAAAAAAINKLVLYIGVPWGHDAGQCAVEH